MINLKPRNTQKQKKGERDKAAKHLHTDDTSHYRWCDCKKIPT